MASFGLHDPLLPRDYVLDQQIDVFIVFWACSSPLFEAGILKIGHETSPLEILWHTGRVCTPRQKISQNYNVDMLFVN